MSAWRAYKYDWASDRWHSAACASNSSSFVRVQAGNYVVAGRTSADVAAIVSTSVSTSIFPCFSSSSSSSAAAAASAAEKMPVVVMHGGSGAGSGNCTLSSKSMGPNSHLCLAVVTLVFNPPLGTYIPSASLVHTAYVYVNLLRV